MRAPFAWRDTATARAGIIGFVFALLSLSADAAVEIPLGDQRDGIHIRADNATRWQQGHYEVWHLHGHFHLRQGSVRAASHEAILWVERAAPLSGTSSKVIAYLEGNVVVENGDLGMRQQSAGQPPSRLTDQTWFGRFHTIFDIEITAPLSVPASPVMPAIYHRGSALRRPNPDLVQPAQFVAPETLPPTQIQANPTARRIILRQRSGVRGQAKAFQNPNSNETVAVFSSGINVVVDGIVGVDGLTGNKIEVEADRLVIWTANFDTLRLMGESFQSNTTPLEFYLEGNIIFREGNRQIFAERMYYNVTYRYGILLQAEMFTPVPDYEGLLRLKADVLQQVDQFNYLAHGAAATSSQIGTPRYWFQTETATFQDIQRPVVDPFTGSPVLDRAGKQQIDHQMLATSRNNFVYLGGVPVFYWPTIATDLTKPTYYVDQITLRNDSIFGTQVLTDLDAYQLFGIRDAPAGTDWTISTDYMSDRGFALGTRFEYDRPGILNSQVPYRGVLDAWGIHDDGVDILGRDRMSLTPEADLRGRVLWQHRQQLYNNFQLTAELGFISDRNFLEQYFEQEWDQQKDQTTGIELKQFHDNSTWSILADVRLNDFFTQTEWLPRFDHHVIGHSFLFDRLTWTGHSQVGYARLRTASAPQDPVDLAKFDPLAWEADVKGLRADTRHEVDLPLDLGPVRLSPYVAGGLTYWGEDLSGTDVSRAFGQTGARASLPMWSVDPTIQSTLLNVNGLAHKVTFEAEYLYADADEDLSRFPLYDPLDDDSVEHFRRRFFFDTFGGMAGGNVPLAFDERYYALRSGLQGSITSPSAEIVDDLSLFKFGVHQRWQTKRGLPGQQRIIDWVTFNVGTSLYTNADRDNFGEELGMLNYDFRWHVGDRLTLLSDGYADLFTDGLKMITFGGTLRRPENGQLYLGFRSIEGPFSSSILTASVSYRMTDKWLGIASTAVDFGPTGNIGQSLRLIRVGESFLVGLGLTVDQGRDNVGASFIIEPRFLQTASRRVRDGVWIPPAGYYGL